MTCQEIMIPDPPTLSEHDTVAKAAEKLLSHRMLGLPVVDRQGRYLGMFAKSRLFGLLLPAVVAVEDLLPQIAQLQDLGFLSDNLEDMRERLHEIAQHPVGQYADRSVPVLRPNSPLMAAVLMLYRTRNFIPVVDPDTGRLAGIVSTWDAITKLTEK